MSTRSEWKVCLGSLVLSWDMGEIDMPQPTMPLPTVRAAVIPPFCTLAKTIQTLVKLETNATIANATTAKPPTQYFYRSKQWNNCHLTMWRFSIFNIWPLQNYRVPNWHTISKGYMHVMDANEAVSPLSMGFLTVLLLPSRIARTIQLYQDDHTF